METIESISTEEWEQIVGEFIEREVEGFDEFPINTFFEAWAVIEETEPMPVPVQVRVQEGQVSLVTPPDTTLKAEKNRLWLEDGRVLVFTLESVQA